MQIHFERMGGFAGMRKAVSLESESFPPEEGKKLQEMIDAAGFFDLPSKFPAPKDLCVISYSCFYRFKLGGFWSKYTKIGMTFPTSLLFV